jgi:hypothetical protein
MYPSIGRIVIFQQSELEAPVNGSREHPAIITRVWSDQMVNLTVLFDSSGAAPRGSIYLESSDSRPAQGPSWHWPPRVE